MRIFEFWVTDSDHLLGRGVCADNILHFISVGVLEAEATGSQPHPLMVGGPESVHDGHHLALQLQHCKGINQLVNINSLNQN